MEQFLKCITFEEVVEDLFSLLAEKAPSVKQGACQFIEKAARVTYIDTLKRIVKQLAPILIKLTDDSSGEVRDAALFAVGVIVGRTGAQTLGAGTFNL